MRIQFMRAGEEGMRFLREMGHVRAPARMRDRVLPGWGPNQLKTLNGKDWKMDILSLLIFILPCYVANAAPVLLGGGAPMDLGASLGDGRRILGDAKTVRGFVGGVAAGTAVGGMLALFLPLAFFAGAWMQFLSGFLLSLGALFGDAAGSFVKRRMGLEPGKPFILDQAGFIIMGLMFAYPVAHGMYTVGGVVFLLALSWLLHLSTNVAANRFGLKRVPW